MVKHLNLTVLNDNEPAPGLKNRWGWSILLESEKWKVLFDADTSPKVIEYNAEQMDIDLRNMDFAFLSHYHRDHYGGFKYIGKICPGLKIYVPPGNPAFLKRWGFEPVEIDGPLKLGEGLWSSGPATAGSIKEHALGIEVDDVGLVVIVGCSHPGVDALTARLKEISGEDIYLVIGGYHSPSHTVLDNLASMSRYICPAHCSGSDAKNYVKIRYPEKYYHVKTGTKGEIEGQRGIL
ncbi:MAG: MBL fold metallo-hydrolase [Nitrospiraceae bacterium]|nr:MBL fold metallo-hydrolase [Nitrospiraceae bacterium]